MKYRHNLELWEKKVYQILTIQIRVGLLLFFIKVHGGLFADMTERAT